MPSSCTSSSGSGGCSAGFLPLDPVLFDLLGFSVLPCSVCVLGVAPSARAGGSSSSGSSWIAPISLSRTMSSAMSFRVSEIAPCCCSLAVSHKRSSTERCCALALRKAAIPSSSLFNLSPSAEISRTICLRSSRTLRHSSAVSPAYSPISTSTILLLRWTKRPGFRVDSCSWKPRVSWRFPDCSGPASGGDSRLMRSLSRNWPR